MDKSRIFIADDHQLVIDGLKAFIDNSENLMVCGEANDGGRAIEIINQFDFDLAIVDLEMPVLNGIQVSEKLIKSHPNLKILILTMLDEEGVIKKLKDIGVHGYLIKTSSQDEILNAINTVLSGEKYFKETAQVTNRNSLLSGATNSELLAQITEREKEILKYIAQGLTNREVGEKLFISHRTVDTHRTNLAKKLNAKNIADLIRFAIKNGLAD